jgi:beta-xylosidase
MSPGKCSGILSYYKDTKLSPGVIPLVISKAMKQAASIATVLLCAGTFLRADPARNPIIHADVPDIAIIRVANSYYMSSTTMHMSPGLPIMKSEDLVNWRTIGYASEVLEDNDVLGLKNGKNAYGKGSWASSLRFHKGIFYASTFSASTGRTHVFTTRDIEKGPWKESSFKPAFHDHSLFFDDDGRVYMLHGAGNLRLTELAADAASVKSGGFDEVVIQDATAVAGPNKGLPAEGSQLFKVNGKYYVFNITWPRGGMRTVLIHRADKITGPYEGRVALQDQGVAQGGLIDTPDGKWWAYLFQDHGAVGRIPFMVPVKWEDGWPVLGVNGKVPEILELPDAKAGVSGIVASDEFTARTLPLAWQWNHNPDNDHWSLSKRPGALRLTTGAVAPDVLSARNTLTQRTFGPECSATTILDTTLMKDGDCAGLIALQKKYGFVGVRMAGNDKSIVMVSAQKDSPEEIESIPFTGNAVYLRIDSDFKNRADTASFAYSLDGRKWTAIGKPLKMAYTLPHFMGYRFGLFNFATKIAGGSADFDWFRISDKLPPK